jgi:cyclopropane-fatty-acyl-phospholipid synthase
MARQQCRFRPHDGEHPIAEHTDTANEQHYELPPRFFELTLGPKRKYSCCLFPHGDETLAEAEDAALDATIDHAALADGQAFWNWAAAGARSA